MSFTCSGKVDARITSSVQASSFIIYVFLGYKVSNFVLKMDVTDVYKNPKFEGFDRESRPTPFKTMFPRLDFLLFCRTKPYG